MIHDVKIHPLKRIPDARGTVLHMLRADDPHFLGFGEIYFSTVFPGAIKAWHSRPDATLNYSVPIGRVELVLFDNRADSPSLGSIQKIHLGQDASNLVIIPPSIWVGFACAGPATAMVANCATAPYNEDLVARLPVSNDLIPYEWDQCE